jgi:hypothetical protein
VIFGEGGVYVGDFLVAGIDTIRINQQVREHAPSGGWKDVTIDFDGRPEDMSGQISFEGVHCRLRPSTRAPEHTLAGMSFPDTPEVANASDVDHSDHRKGVPPDFDFFAPQPAAAKAMSDHVKRAVTGDSDSWMLNRLQKGTINDFHYFKSASDTTKVFVWAAYSYLRFDGLESSGWVVAQFRNASIYCIRYHDNNNCMAPRVSRSDVIASLGEGRPHLGPVSVNANCFVTRSRVVMRKETRTVGSGDINAPPETVTEFHPETVQETFFQCPSQTVELECAPEGFSDRFIERFAGPGSTREHALPLINGHAGPSAGDVAHYNARIRAGTCVRVK